jgi:hypothetical protein
VIEGNFVVIILPFLSLSVIIGFLFGCGIIKSNLKSKVGLVKSESHTKDQT